MVKSQYRCKIGKILQFLSNIEYKLRKITYLYMGKIKIGEPFFDFFSWGHLASGVVIFALSHHLCYINSIGNPLTGLISLLVTICAMWLWEIIENTMFVKIGWKFEGRIDSVLNSLGDIFFSTLSAGICWLIDVLLRIYAPSVYYPWYYLVIFGLFVIFLTIFHIHGVIYLKKNPVQK